MEVDVAAVCAGKRTGPALASIAVAVVVAVVSGYFITDGRWISISRTFCFLPYFVAGYRIRQLDFSLRRDFLTRSLAMLFMGAVVWIAYRNHAAFLLRWSLGRESLAELGRLTAGGGARRVVMLFLQSALVVAFMQLVPRRRLFFTALGATTLSVYIWHAFLLQRVFRSYHWDVYLLGSAPLMLLTVLAIVVGFGFGPVPRFMHTITSGSAFWDWLVRTTQPRTKRVSPSPTPQVETLSGRGERRRDSA